MSESSNFTAYKKKLNGLCEGHNLVYRLRCDTYPISLTIKPLTDIDTQMSMLEEVEDKGYISPDASLVFYLRDGNITYKTDQTFTISETLFNKLKNLFKNLYSCWLQFFFMDIMTNQKLQRYDMPIINDETEDTLPPDAQPFETIEDDCDIPDTGEGESE